MLIICLAYYITPSIHSLPLILFRVAGSAGAYPSCHRARGGVHPGQVTSLSQGYVIYRLLYNSTLFFQGVLLVNESGTGIWLLHSTPKFPYARDENSFWPSTGVKNAQTFICVTFPYDEFRKIGKHLQYIRAFPFDHRIPGDFHTELQDVVNKVDVPPDDNFQQLTSSKRSNFYSIAKNHSEDLYVNIAQKVSSDLLVQTWGCQMRRDTSFCKENKFKVENINTTATSLGQWNNTKDHSKWCVAKDPENNWMCVADVNRAPSQYARRGGALCINDKKIKDIFQNFANKIEDCQNRMKSSQKYAICRKYDFLSAACVFRDFSERSYGFEKVSATAF
uniref:Deoxyribonuclease-2-alpha n=1 Tax=Oreochromis aureus TaxID=47969 RepID=A0A668USL1_OREAU